MKVLNYLTFPVLLAGLVALGIWVSGQPRLHWPERQFVPDARPCPLVLRLEELPLEAIPEPQGLEPPLRGWAVVESDGEGTAPKVAVRHAEVRSQAGQMVPACILEVTELPLPPFAGLDWRIGHRLALPAELRGRTGRAVFTLDLSADHAAGLPSGSIYLYAGGTPATVPLGEVQPDWRPIRVEMELDPAATFVEVWYRLAFQGGIDAPVTLVLADPVLTLLPPEGR